MYALMLAHAESRLSNLRLILVRDIRNGSTRLRNWCINADCRCTAQCILGPYDHSAATPVLLLDTLGTRRVLGLADIAFVGGS